MPQYDEEEMGMQDLDGDALDADVEQEEGWFDNDPAEQNEAGDADSFDNLADYDSEALYDMAEEAETDAQEEDGGEWDTTAAPDSDDLTDMAEDKEDEEQEEAEMREWAMDQHLENDAVNETEREAAYDY